MAAEVPVDHFIEWLAEWGREVRRRQHGLLLSTAHRAKGLEFNHVAVLDGGWDRVDQDEDLDAPRRLYYVAMTRARQTLALASLVTSYRNVQPHAARSDSVRESAPPAYLTQRHALHQAIADIPAVLQRPAVTLPPAAPEYAPELFRRYRRPGLDEINLGFAGRHHVRHPVHRAIAALAPGDSVRSGWMRAGDGSCWIDPQRWWGVLARAFEPPAGMRCVCAAVHAVVIWSREASEPKFHAGLKCEQWEVVVPELISSRTRSDLAESSRCPDALGRRVSGAEAGRVLHA